MSARGIRRRGKAGYALKRLARGVSKAQRIFLRYDCGERRTPADFTRAAVGVVWLARFFYLITAYGITTFLLRFDRASPAQRGAISDPLWPIELLAELGIAGWLYNPGELTAAGLVAALLAALFPGMVVWRLAVFLYLFLFVAAINSYGAINHGLHFHVYISFALLFLPGSASRPRQMRRKDVMACIMTFWFAQSIILFTYTLAGLWKIVQNNLTLLSPTGFVRTLLSRLMDSFEGVPLLLPYIVNHEYPAQFLLLGAVYLQFFAIFALFRPHLHRPWGAALILFHLGTMWLLNVFFNENMLFLGMFMLFSPLAPEKFSWLGMLRSMALAGIPFRLWAAGNATPKATRAWLVYDGECPLCRNYAQYLDVRQALGNLELINARDGGPLVDEIRAQVYNLNEGMVLKLNGRYYYGSDALHLLALLSNRRGLFSLTNRLLFGTPGAAWAAYPLLKLGRRLLLRLKRVPPLPR